MDAVRVATWLVTLAAVTGVIVRPARWPEAIWAVAGALLLVGAGLLPVRAALVAVGRGTDVYLFLAGMMLLSEVARREGLFDVLAKAAAALAGRSAGRLFTLVYAVGIVVTAFLSNDATAVVLTPAVFAAARAAGAEPLPHLFACALIANAASFALPMANPANLVLYASRVPPLPVWLGRFALPAAASIAVTFVALRLVFRRELARPIEPSGATAALTTGGLAAACGIVATAAALLVASATGTELGWPTALCGGCTAALVLARKREAPWPLLRGMSWSVLPLVAGLFVLVEGLAHTGVIGTLARWLRLGADRATGVTAVIAGATLAFGSNAVNNLPAGLVASSAVARAHLPDRVTDALLVGVDLGPNLSITGSLATILWLAALRREGIEVGFGRFLRVGLVAMPPALAAALAVLAIR